MSTIVEKPWGQYEEFIRAGIPTNMIVVKRLIVNPGQKLSLQAHQFRSEHWFVESGHGYFQVGDEVHEGYTGAEFNIPEKVIHRIIASGNGVSIIETQRGRCEENDIVRLEDIYGR